MTSTTSGRPPPPRPRRQNSTRFTGRRWPVAAGVVAVHLSAALSGTFGVAETTAAEIGPTVRGIDSKSAAMNTGFVALAAARAAAGGADLDTVAKSAAGAVSRNHGFIVVHQLENLRRSGRIGGA